MRGQAPRSGPSVAANAAFTRAAPTHSNTSGHHHRNEHSGSFGGMKVLIDVQEPYVAMQQWQRGRSTRMDRNATPSAVIYIVDDDE